MERGGREGHLAASTNGGSSVGGHCSTTTFGRG
jgi:hypothetical protein